MIPLFGSSANEGEWVGERYIGKEWQVECRSGWLHSVGGLEAREWMMGGVV